MFDRSQLMRGTLEGCILHIIGAHPTYGYDIVTRLQGFGFADVREGTIYPLLMRLEKKKAIAGEYRPSALGPRRKYYSLTPDGRQLLYDFIACWGEHRRAVDSVLDWRGEDADAE